MKLRRIKRFFFARRNLVNKLFDVKDGIDALERIKFVCITEGFDDLTQAVLEDQACFMRRAERITKALKLRLAM